MTHHLPRPAALRASAVSIALTALLALCVGVAGCNADPVSTSPSSNPAVNVELLFEHEGCRVFRFVDGGSHRYYVRCESGSATALNSHTESCGKNCRRTVQDPTVTLP